MGNLESIVQFLRTYPPFNHIDVDVLEQIASRIAVVYFKAGQEICADETPSLHVLRSGSLEIRSSKGVLIDRLSEGGCFGYGPMLTGSKNIYRFNTLEDGLVYLISQDDFNHLRHQHSEFDFFFAQESRRRFELQGTPISKDIELNTEIGEIMHKQAVTTQSNASIHEAAKIMTEHRVSSILVTSNDKLSGIVTDRDLRTRVVAENRDMKQSISSIMTSSIISLSPNDSVHDAYLTMMSKGVHHLPITHLGKVEGIISISDLMRSRNSEPLFVIQAIKRAKNTTDLESISKKFPSLIQKLILADVKAEEVGRIISSLTDCLTSALIELAKAQYGAAPCEYVWLCFGSQGRREQMLTSDQDNGLLLEDTATRNDIEYFLKLAKFVCDGLNLCGIRHCPGNIMAMNEKWCLQLKDWQKQFFHWISEPEPKALMHASIFYDMRMLEGNNKLYESLQHAVFEKVKSNSIFLAHMLENALSHTPPLGFFKTFVLERDGDHQSVLDLKHRGTIPIVDLARLYSLSEGILVNNTMERLRELKNSKAIHSETADTLCDAHEFIANLRLENQQNQITSGQNANNSLDPKHISPLVRHQLKDAFAAVQFCQQTTKLRFGSGVL